MGSLSKRLDVFKVFNRFIKLLSLHELDALRMLLIHYVLICYLFTYYVSINYMLVFYLI